MHDTYSGQTLLDLNRAGTPLIEIISDPDMHSTDQAAAYVRKVQNVLRSIGSSDADMEKVSYVMVAHDRGLDLNLCNRDQCESMSTCLSRHSVPRGPVPAVK